jgi:hypothetical protein
VTAAAIFVAGCGGGSSKQSGAPASATNAPGSSTTTKGSATTTTLAASAADTALAKVASLTVADLGSRWQQYKAAPGPLPVSGGCAYSPSGPLSKVGYGAFYAGPQIKFKANTSYAYSTTVVFPDEASATAWATVRKTGAYKECVRKHYDASARQTNATLRVVTGADKDPYVGRTQANSQYVDFTRYNSQYRAAGGKYLVNGAYDLYLYRHGRVLVTFELDRSTAPKSDPNATAVGNSIATAILKVLMRTDAQS